MPPPARNGSRSEAGLDGGGLREDGVGLLNTNAPPSRRTRWLRSEAVRALIARDAFKDAITGGAGHDRARVDAADERTNVEEILV